MKSWRSLGAGLATVVLWASAFAAIRVAAPEFGVAGLTLVRAFIGAGALLALAPLLGVRVPARRDVPALAACGLTGVALYQVFLNAGEVTVDAGTASIFIAAAPVVSILVTRLVSKVRLAPLTVAGSAVALAGAALVCIGPAGFVPSWGIGLIVVASVAQGIYHPLIKPLLVRYTGLEVATYSLVAGCLLLLPLAPFSWTGITSASTGAWAAVIYLGLGPSALGFVLWAVAIGGMPTARATALLYLIPPVAVAIAAVGLGEVPTTWALVGGAVVLAGVVLINRGTRTGAH